MSYYTNTKVAVVAQSTVKLNIKEGGSYADVGAFQLVHDALASTDFGTMNTPGAWAFTSANIKMGNLPTADPAVAGRLWSNAGVLTLSAG